MQAGRDAGDGDVRGALGEQRDQLVAPAPVALPHPPYVPVVCPRLYEVGEEELVGHADRQLALPLGREHRVHQRVREHQPAEADRRGQALADRADVHHVRRVEPLHGPDGLPVVAELAVVVVLDDQSVGGVCPVDDGRPALGVQRAAGRVLVRGRQQHRAGVGGRQPVTRAPCSYTGSGTPRMPARPRIVRWKPRP